MYHFACDYRIENLKTSICLCQVVASHMGAGISKTMLRLAIAGRWSLLFKVRVKFRIRVSFTVRFGDRGQMTWVLQSLTIGDQVLVAHGHMERIKFLSFLFNSRYYMRKTKVVGHWIETDIASILPQGSHVWHHAEDFLNYCFQRYYRCFHWYFNFIRMYVNCNTMLIGGRG